jgi:hypothetical protein
MRKLAIRSPNCQKLPLYATELELLSEMKLLCSPRFLVGCNNAKNRIHLIDTTTLGCLLLPVCPPTPQHTLLYLLAPRPIWTVAWQGLGAECGSDFRRVDLRFRQLIRMQSYCGITT